MSPSLPVSSSFRKSFVFCAKSFRCTRESRWCETMSAAALSNRGMAFPRSISDHGTVSLHVLTSLREFGTRTSPCCDGLLKFVALIVPWCSGCGMLVWVGLARGPRGRDGRDVF